MGWQNHKESHKHHHVWSSYNDNSERTVKEWIEDAFDPFYWILTYCNFLYKILSSFKICFANLSLNLNLNIIHKQGRSLYIVVILGFLFYFFTYFSFLLHIFLYFLFVRLLFHSMRRLIVTSSLKLLLWKIILHQKLSVFDQDFFLDFINLIILQNKPFIIFFGVKLQSDLQIWLWR